MASVPQPTSGAARQDLYRRIEKHNFTPLWEVYHDLIPKDPVIWLDGLDMRIVRTFAAQFHEPYPEDEQPVTRGEGASNARYGNNLKPLGAVAPFGKTSPIFSYPYDRTRETLARLAKEGD